MKNYKYYLNLNKEYLWNPFTQMQEYLKEDPVIVKEGKGIKLIDVNGKEYYDAYSSLWLNTHGHNNKDLNNAIRNQLEKIAHSTLLGSANIVALELAKKLVEITPPSLKKVFFSDSGAEAVEIAIKISYLYWKNLGKNKKIFLKMTNAYHGDTLGAVSVGGIDIFHKAFCDLLFKTIEIPYPYTYRFKGDTTECIEYCLKEFEKTCNKYKEEIAALIVEPMIQGAAGMITMPRGFLTKIYNLCKENNILVIADEVATGFGRTGQLFACNHENINPDILTLGKMLTGGYLPVAATLTSNNIYEAFLGSYNENKTFYHGHSYTGNQLGCAAALSNIQLLESKNLVKHVQLTSNYTKKFLEKFKDLNYVGEVRSLGFMTGIELVKDKKTKERLDNVTCINICKNLKNLGLLTRPLGNVITFVPPLISTKEEIEEMLKIIYKVLKELKEVN